jgi:hypothetical protein
MTASIRMFFTFAAVAMAFTTPVVAKSPATAAICGRAVPVDFIVGYPDNTPAEGKSQWGPKARSALAKSLTESLAKLCKQKLVTPMMFHDERKLVFIENNNANIISLWSVDRDETGTDGGYQWQRGTLYVEVPFLDRFTPKTLDPEMRRAILCSYNQDAKELDEIACLPD